MISKNELSKIGIGTWGIGGYLDADPNNDDNSQIDALIYTLNKGINYVESVYSYAQGKAINLLSQAVKKSGIDRHDIFITLSIYQQSGGTTIKDVEKYIDNFLRTFNMDYIDNVQLAMGLVKELGIKVVENMVEKLIKKRKIRFISLTNSSPEFLVIFHQMFQDKFFAHEGVFNFEIRENEENGITGYAKKNNILNVAYQPLRRNQTASRNWPLLIELSEKYSKTQNQIILNWISSKDFFPLVKSSTISHINENLNSFNFKVDDNDLKRLNNFIIPNYSSPKIDWDEIGDGIKIHKLPILFDQIYPRKL